MKFFKKKEKEEKIKKDDNKPKINSKLNKKKDSKLYSAKNLKVIRAVLWFLIGFVVIRGAVSLVRGSEADKIKTENNKLLERVNKQSGLEARTYSFAEAFTREYFTRYPSNKDDFKNRILKFTSEQLADDMNNDSYSEIISVSAFSFEKYSENQFNVKVKANLKQYTSKAGQEKVAADKRVYDTNIVTECIEIPICVDNNGNFAVDDLPVMVSDPVKSDVSQKEYSGQNESDTDVVNKITDSLNQFFKAYYELDQTQIDYFVATGANKIEGTGGKYKFERIDVINVFKQDNNSHLATVELTINSYGNEVKQRFNVTLVKEGDKYLIKELNSRKFNLNIQN